MKNLIFTILLLASFTAWGAGLTVSSTNGYADSLTLTTKVTNKAVAQPGAGSTNLIAIDSTGAEVALPLGAVGSGTNIVDTTDMVLGTVYTNTSGSNLTVTVGISTTSTSLAVEADLEIDNNLDGAFETVIPAYITASVGELDQRAWASGFVQPNGRYKMVTIQGSVVIFSGASQRVYSAASVSGVAGSGGGTTYTNNSAPAGQINGSGIGTNLPSGLVTQASLTAGTTNLVQSFTNYYFFGSGTTADGKYGYAGTNSGTGSAKNTFYTNYASSAWVLWTTNLGSAPKNNKFYLISNGVVAYTNTQNLGSIVLQVYPYIVTNWSFNNLQFTNIGLVGSAPCPSMTADTNAILIILPTTNNVMVVNGSGGALDSGVPIGSLATVGNVGSGGIIVSNPAFGFSPLAINQNTSGALTELDSGSGGANSLDVKFADSYANFTLYQWGRTIASIAGAASLPANIGNSSLGGGSFVVLSGSVRPVFPVWNSYARIGLNNAAGFNVPMVYGSPLSCFFPILAGNSAGISGLPDNNAVKNGKRKPVITWIMDDPNGSGDGQNTNLCNQTVVIRTMTNLVASGMYAALTNAGFDVQIGLDSVLAKHSPRQWPDCGRY